METTVQPKPFLTANVDLAILRKTSREITEKQKTFNLAVENVCIDLASRLMQLIPPSEEVLIRMMKTSMDKKSSETFLERILRKMFDKESLSFRKEFSLQMFKVAVPFFMDFDEMVRQFESLNTFWADNARIQVSKGDPYYYFLIERLA